MRSSDISGLRALGAGPLPPARSLETIALDTPGPVHISFTTSELIAHCPVTGQRDLYDATVEITATATLESKSLKLYLASWDKEQILAEDLANTIADDVAEALGSTAERVAVTLEQNVRGGISISVTTVR
jgi:NADPH-dependent 7-cyano-7-deazaguanine reductase QueF